MASPLPEDIVRLVLGHSLLSFQKISVVSCVVNSDYTKKIEVLISPPAKTVQLKLKNSTAFAFTLLPDRKTRQKKAPEDLDLAFWVQKIAASRP